MTDTPASRVRTRLSQDSPRRRGLRPAEIERQCELNNEADGRENLVAWVEDVSVIDNGDVRQSPINEGGIDPGHDHLNVELE
jgi:hypothetical protein